MSEPKRQRGLICNRSAAENLQAVVRRSSGRKGLERCLIRRLKSGSFTESEGAHTDAPGADSTGAKARVKNLSRLLRGRGNGDRVAAATLLKDFAVLKGASDDRNDST